MLRIDNVKVYDLEESVIASGNAMRIEPVEYTKEEFEKGLERMKKLVNASQKTNVHCHDNALTGIRVSFDIVYPQYWTPEFQRYHFADIVTSQSKMHRLLMMDLDKACNKYVSQEVIDVVEQDIFLWNYINNEYESGEIVIPMREVDIRTNNKQEALYYAWMKVISDCPMGLELFMRVSTNYKQLQTIYAQRYNHKLKEDWGAFCDFIEKLPYGKELIINNLFGAN